MDGRNFRKLGCGMLAWNRYFGLDSCGINVLTQELLLETPKTKWLEVSDGVANLDIGQFQVFYQIILSYNWNTCDKEDTNQKIIMIQQNITK